MIVVPAVLDRAEVASIREALADAAWIDGNATSGHLAARAKRNAQLDEEDPLARTLGTRVLDALGRAPLFVAAALPLKVYPPLFNRYGVGEGFAPHVDAAIRIRRGSDFRLRTDLSATLFLSDPADYDGGALVAGEAAPVRLAAGDLLLYPATTVHHVTPVTRGERLACFFWIQSMVRDTAARAMLLELDRAIQALTAAGADEGELVRLTGLYHNLLRRWAEL